MLENLTGWHALLILAIVLLVFGSTKLPALAKSVGQSVRILKDEVHEGSEATRAAQVQAAQVQAAQVQAPQVQTAPATADAPADVCTVRAS